MDIDSWRLKRKDRKGNFLQKIKSKIKKLHYEVSRKALLPKLTRSD